MLPSPSGMNRGAGGRKHLNSGRRCTFRRALPRLRDPAQRWTAYASERKRAHGQDTHTSTSCGPRGPHPAGNHACAGPRAARDARLRLTEPTARPRPVPAAAALIPAPRPGSSLPPRSCSGLGGPVRPLRARRRRRLRQPRRRERRRGRGGDWPAAAPAPIMQRMARH